MDKLITALLILFVNLPFLYVLTTYDWDVQLAIYGHSPNQFLFLLLIFPVAIWATVQGYIFTINALQEIGKHTDAVKKLVTATRYKLFIIVSILVGMLLAYVDSDFTPSDFYQWQPELVNEVAVANQQIVILKYAGKEDSPGYIKLKDEIGKYFAQEKQGNPYMLAFEMIEFATVGTLVCLFLCITYINLKNVRYIKGISDANTRKSLLAMLRKAVPLGVIFLLSTLFWPPFREYNIKEIEIFIYPYNTIDPLYAYLFATLLAIAYLWIYFSKLNPNLLEKVIAVVPFIFSGGLMGMAKWKPEYLVDVVGSGMGYGNVVVLVLLVGFTGLFGTEIYRQIVEE